MVGGKFSGYTSYNLKESYPSAYVKYKKLLSSNCTLYVTRQFCFHRSWPIHHYIISSFFLNIGLSSNPPSSSIPLFKVPPYSPYKGYVCVKVQGNASKCNVYQFVLLHCRSKPQKRVCFEVYMIHVYALMLKVFF